MTDLNTLMAQQKAAVAAEQAAPVPEEKNAAVLQAEQLIKLGEKMGAFKAYDSQLPVAELAGTRIVKCLYQERTSGKYKGTKIAENSYTRIPTTHLTEEVVIERIAELAPYVLLYLQGIEDSIIKKYHAAGGTQVYIAGLSLDSLIEHLEESSAGSRLNKEKIGAWFDDCLADSLTVLFAAHLNITEDSTEGELQKLETVLAAYKAKFESLASGKVYLKEPDCQAMIKVIDASEDAASSAIGKRFKLRLTKMNEVKEDLLLSL